MTSLIIIIFITYILWFFSVLVLSNTLLSNKNSLIRVTSLSFSVVQLLAILLMWFELDGFSTESINVFCYQLDYQWSFMFNFNYVLGIDNISFFFILLTFLLIPLCILISWNSVKYKYSNFVMCLLLISFILFNIFCILDLFFFYIFFESILLPMFIMIGVWGSRQRKIHAVYQFFFYTLIGSLFMLLGLLVIYSHVQSTDIRILYNTNFSFYRQILLWISFFVAFCVKVPLFPFHIWLPEAHVEAPTVGSVILAGVLLKLGTYGLLRFVIPLFPSATYFFTPFVYTICILGIIYTCCSTIRQVDLKKIIAYSSVSHMSFVILGLFSYNLQGISGSIFLMLSHGIVSGGLFFCIGCVYDRYKTRILRYYSGMVSVMPLFTLAFFILTLANISFPGTSSFIGEFLILLGLFESNFFAAVLSTLSIILTAIYSIWLFNRMSFNKLNTMYFNKYADLSKKELTIAFIFCFITVFFGIKSSYILNMLDYPITDFLMYKTSN